jgi:transcriptional regulator with XRE-family HTH domain
MTTSNRKTKKTSDAVSFLENLTGGALTLGRLLYAIRMGEALSQAAFAKKLGVSKAHICDVEKDRRVVSPARAQLWAKKLGYSPEQFVELALQASLKKEGLNYKVKLSAA